MAKYPELSKRREQLLVGRTSSLFRAGYTPEEIANALGQPLERIKYWIGLVRQADKIYAEING